MILDKIKSYGLQYDIDIYKAVCNLRSQRSGMIQTEKQYQFLYLAIKKYIENLNSATSSANQHFIVNSNSLLNNHYVNN